MHDNSQSTNRRNKFFPLLDLKKDEKKVTSDRIVPGDTFHLSFFRDLFRNPSPRAHQ